MTTYVRHDEARWRVAKAVDIDGEPGYELVRRVPGRGAQVIIARESECAPDTHEPIRVLRDDEAVLRFNVVRKTVTLAWPRGRTKIATTLGGILAMALRQQAMNKKRDKAFAKRTRGRA